MVMGWVWTLMAAAALAVSLKTGTTAAVGQAALDGARAAVQLTETMAGPVLLWSALLSALESAGLTGALGRLLAPLLGRLFPSARDDARLSDCLTANVTANLLGLGSAATPPGIQAAERLAARVESRGELARLVVLNTASIQLFPATVAALRTALGSARPLDILPAVWLTSLASAAAGLLAERVLRRC